MSKRIILIFTVLVLTALVLFTGKHRSIEKGEQEEENEGQQALFVKERLQYEYDLLKDPVTGEIPADIRERELALARTLPVRGEGNSLFRTATLNSYNAAGPTNIGGRTRAITFDRRYNGSTNRVIMSGSVSGGIMRSADGGATWTRVSPLEDVHNVTCFAQDPRAAFQDTWYAGTGEALGNSTSGSGAFYFGFGIFKSTNNGVTWTALGSTRNGSLSTFDNVFDLVHRIAVNPANGDVFVAAQQTIRRSKDGGASWTTVKGGSSQNNITGNTDVTVNNDGSRIFCAFHLKNSSDKGVFVSSSGDANTWTLLGGATDNSPIGWTVNSSTDANVSWGRILMALAPSDQNILYVMYENGKSQAAPTLKPEADLFKCDLSTGSPVWTNLTPNLPDFPGNKVGSDPLAVQGGYDMVLKVKPDDANFVVIGGTNLYRSTNGFTSTAATVWIGGYNTNLTYGQYANSHPDMHNIDFDPSSNNRAIAADDGGIQSTIDVTASSVSWSIIRQYQTLQYNYVAIDPIAGRNNFLGGAQDNGTTFRDSTQILGARPVERPTINDHEKISGGDGGAVAIGNLSGGSQYMYYGVQLGDMYRDNLTNYFTYTATNIRPDTNLLTHSPQTGFGEFVTQFRVSPDNTETAFYVNFNKLFRSNAVSTVSPAGWQRLAGVENIINPSGGTDVAIRSLAFSRGPYLAVHSLYMGTTNGKVFRLDDYQNAANSTVPAEITPTGMTGTVQDISVNPNDDNEVMAVVSNYSSGSTTVVNIWWTKNAKSATPTWYNSEGNLSLPSIRSCAIVTKKDASNNPVTEYYVGTSIGLYSAVNIGTILTGGGTVTWLREGGDVLNWSVVTSLSYRPTDNVLLVGTHGNGMFFTNIGSPNFTPNINTGVFDPVRNDKSFIVKMYPTVTTGSTINYTVGNLYTTKSVSIEIVNIAGQRLMQLTRPYQSNSINISSLPSGMYIMNIISNDRKNQFIQKFIKQ